MRAKNAEKSAKHAQISNKSATMKGTDSWERKFYTVVGGSHLLIYWIRSLGKHNNMKKDMLQKHHSVEFSLPSSVSLIVADFCLFVHVLQIFMHFLG